MADYREEYRRHVDRCNRITDDEIELNELRRISPLVEQWAYLDKRDAERRAALAPRAA